MINIKDDIFLDALGKRLKAVRTERGYTQESLAYKADLSLSQIGRIERGTINPTISTLKHICKVLEIELSYFFEGL